MQQNKNIEKHTKKPKEKESQQPRREEDMKKRIYSSRILTAIKNRKKLQISHK